MCANEANSVSDEDSEAAKGVSTNRAAYALLPFRATPRGERGGVAAKGTTLGGALG